MTFKIITWKDHGKIDLDAWAHYFDDANGREYVLLYEDFPGSTYLDEQGTHEVLKIGDQTSIQLAFSDKKEIENITGYFTLYREIHR